MSNTIKQKRGTSNPSATDLVVGELAINTTDGGVFTKTDGGSVVEVGGSSNALVNNSSGYDSLGVGTNALDSETSDFGTNTGIGASALTAVTSGTNNVGVGYQAGNQITTSNRNTLLGNNAGRSAGNDNVYLGYAAGFYNTNIYNVAVGGFAFDASGSASRCVAVGFRALTSATNGSYNTANGAYALEDLTTGSSNVAIGYQAGKDINVASYNTIVGNFAGDSLTGSTGFTLTSARNTLIGYAAGDNISNGYGNIVIGYGADASSNNAFYEITLGSSDINSFRIPGLQSGATDGQVLTFNSTNGDLELADVSATVAGGAIYENSQNISANYSITSGKNAMSAGPITIDSGVTVTVTSGSTWTVV